MCLAVVQQGESVGFDRSVRQGERSSGAAFRAGRSHSRVRGLLCGRNSNLIGRQGCTRGPKFKNYREVYPTPGCFSEGCSARLGSVSGGIEVQREKISAGRAGASSRRRKNFGLLITCASVSTLRSFHCG
jgi:hypothetical protein